MLLMYMSMVTAAMAMAAMRVPKVGLAAMEETVAPGVAVTAMTMLTAVMGMEAMKWVTGTAATRG